MWENIKLNWMSTVPGIITAMATLIALFYPDKSAFINQVSGAVAVLSGLVFVLLTKSSNVTGTSLNPRSQIVGIPDPPPTPAAKVKIAQIESKK